jgi:ubiquinone biosynthesis protein UbiJ
MLAAHITRALNRGLADSPRAQSLCRALAGKRLLVQIAGTPWALIMESTGDALNVRRATADAADATIHGGPVSLLALGGAAAQASIQRGEVRIAGDAELARQFRCLTQLLRPDLESELARLVGHVPAHLGARGARALIHWGRRAADTMLRNTAEYLAHERGDLVPRAEAEQFLRGVDLLRERVDRLGAKIEHLDRRTSTLAGAGTGQQG